MYPWKHRNKSIPVCVLSYFLIYIWTLRVFSKTGNVVASTYPGRGICTNFCPSLLFRHKWRNIGNLFIVLKWCDFIIENLTLSFDEGCFKVSRVECTFLRVVKFVIQDVWGPPQELLSPVLYLSAFETYFQKEHILFIITCISICLPSFQVFLALFPRLPIHINSTILEKLFGYYEPFTPENFLTFISA